MRRAAFVVIATAMCLLAVIPASANTITWTVWTSGTAGNAGSTTIGYSGPSIGWYSAYPSWNPVSTFSGGSISNAPNDGIIRLTGGSNASGTNTVTFSQPVTDPVMAIWSLGNPSLTAQFVFGSSEPFTIESGGPSTEYGGSSIFLCSTYTVCGAEGNGTIQFHGTFTSLTWTNPVYEYWYGFTVGVPQAAPVPEPASLALFGSGLVALAGSLRKKLHL